VGRSAFVTFVTAGDPDPKTSLDIPIKALPKAGADIIELGMPFLPIRWPDGAVDPGGRGPARAQRAGMTLKKTLELVRRFFARTTDATPNRA